jgi:hypothetical protein
MNYDFEKEILEIVKFNSDIYIEHINNIIDSMDAIKNNDSPQINYDWILDYYEL